MSMIAAVLASSFGRAAVLAALLIVGLTGVYLKGRNEGRASCLAQGERDVLETIARADRARAAAHERGLDAGRLREDDSFRRD